MYKQLSFAAAILITSSSFSIADDGIWRGRIGVSQNDFSTIWSGGDLEVDYMSLNAGVSYITPDANYFDLAYKTNMDGEWNTLALSPGLNDGKDEDYDRDDITITIGRVLESGLQVYGGYQDSHADIYLPPVSWVQGLNSVVKEEIDITGFFFGVGKSYKLGEGSLNLNFAYGFMDAELIDAIGVKSTADGGDGYSLGAAYSYYFSNTLGVSFEFKQQKYSYDFDLSQGAAAQVTSGDDELTMLGVNLIRQF
jgi:hypothetical protein